MDILKVFATEDINKQVLLTQGFQNSDFYNNHLSLDTLFKDIIQMFITNDRCMMYNKNVNYKINPQTGLIKNTPQKTTKKGNIIEKNITYGSDLTIILNNIIGLLGYEFSMSILTLSLYPTIIKHVIDEIPTTNSYHELIKLLVVIDNAYKVCDANNSVNNTLNNNTFIYNDNNYIDELVAKMRLRISNNNNISFESDKQDCYNIMLDKYDNTTFNTIYVNSIDNLCIELGKYKPCYDNYFMKIWELLFKETHCDMYEYENIYPKFTSDDNNQNVIEMPVITMLNAYAQNDPSIYNIISNINKQMVYIKQYLKNITKKTLMTIDDNDKHITVCVQEMLYEHLAAVFINMLVVYAKNIVILHDYNNNLNKAVKLQFIELFNGFKFTTPALITYTESQLMCLHYIMLTKQNLNNVYEQEEPAKEKTPRSRTNRKTKTNNA